MTTLAQELASLARKKHEEQLHSIATFNDVYQSTINNIKLGKCVWNTSFTCVETEINMQLHEPLIEYVEFYYVATDFCKIN